MEELQSAIRYVLIVVAVVAAMMTGDYLGYKVGRLKLVWGGIAVALLAIIVFAVYAAVVLLG